MLLAGILMRTVEVGAEMKMQSIYICMVIAFLILPLSNRILVDTTYDDTALWAVKTYKPEYLALVDSAHPRLESEVVSVHCQSMKFFRGEEYNLSTDMRVYACQYP